jgi:hypothetical protein
MIAYGEELLVFPGCLGTQGPRDASYQRMVADQCLSNRKCPTESGAAQNAWIGHWNEQAAQWYWP